MGCCLLLLAGLFQDGAKIDDLILKLEDDAFDVREQAQADLIRLGDAATSALRKALDASTDRAELRLRVQAALREIDLAAKSRLVCPEPRRLTLKTEGPLRRLLEEIGRQAELRIDASALDLEEATAVDLTDATLMATLDGLCKGRADRRWEFLDDDRVRFQKEAQPPWPSSYTGAFRVRLTSMKLTRSTDFKAKASLLRLVLEADHERRVKPSRGVEFEILKASDEKGAPLEARRGDEEDEGAVLGRGGAIRINRAWVRMAAAGGPDAPSGGETITLKGLDPAATRVSLQGNAIFRFPLERRDIRFAPPQAGESRDAADLKLRIDAQGAGRWKLSISKARPEGAATGLMEDVERRLDLESLVGVDDDGVEHKGSFQPSGDTMAARIVVVNGVVQQSVDGINYLLQFPGLRGKGAREIRFKFADRVLEKKIPFSFDSIPLP